MLEATGSYWVALATTLAHAGFAVAVINPDQAHHVAKAVLQRAKTDAREARTLARVAATLHPAPWSPPASDTELQQRLAARDTLIALRPQGHRVSAEGRPDPPGDRQGESRGWHDR